MEGQLDLLARRSDPDTAQEAARKLDPATRSRECDIAYAVIANSGTRGATVAEIVAITGKDRGCTARRVTDLHRAGRVVDSGGRRPGPSGRAQIVWLAASPRSA